MANHSNSTSPFSIPGGSSDPGGGGGGGIGPSHNSTSGAVGASSSSSTSNFRSSTNTAGGRYASSSAATSAVGGDVFTSAMRDRQSRGKDPYRHSAGDGSDDLSDESGERDVRSGRYRFGLGKEDFGRQERRETAASFLDSPELLMMYAQSTGDSIPAARLHFMKIMCGYDDESLGRSRGTPTGPKRDIDKRRGGDRAAGR